MRDRKLIGLGLCAFLLSVYLLNYSGVPHSSDGIAMLATADSLVRRGELDMNAYLWMGLQQGSFGPDGELYSRKTMGQVLLSLPLAWLGLKSDQLGLVQAAMLLGPLVAAGTALLVYAAVLLLGYSPAAALATGLAYGLATPALPYSKYFFNDPLTGLALLAAFLAFLFYRKRASAVRAAAVGVALGFAALTRTTSLAMVPLFLLAMWWRELSLLVRHREGKCLVALLPAAAAFVVAFSAFLALSGLFNYLRYGDPLASGYLAEESFSGNWLAGIAGLLISPGRGLFLYAPVLLLAIPGWLRLRRDDAPAAWLILAVFTAHVLIYGKWFMWHGGYAWGPRFLIPALPFLVLCLAPLWGRYFWRVAGLILALLSFLPQLLGSLVHFAPFEDALLETGLPLFAPETFWQPRYSPLLGQWRYVTPANLDFAWAMAVDGSAKLDLVALGSLLCTVSLAGFALVRLIEGKGRLALLASLLALAAVTPLHLARNFASGKHPLDPILAFILERERPGDALLLTRPADSLTVSDRYQGRLPQYGLPQPALDWLPGLEERYRRLWLLGDDVPLERSEMELWLHRWGYRMFRQTVSGSLLALYARLLSPPDVLAHNVDFEAGITLLEAAVAVEDGMIFASLNWQVSDPLDIAYKVFVQAYDAQGNLIAQDDAMPDSWLRPTTTWKVGEVIEDRHGLLLPAGAQPSYFLVGLYDAGSGIRLPLSSGGDALVIRNP